MAGTVFKSERISKTSTITLNAPIDKVFPLFNPINEKEWAAGWNPHVLYPSTGSVEERMVFRTLSHHGQGSDSIWTITKYHPDQSFIEYFVFTSERLWWISIQCDEGNGGDKTVAKITYTYNGLTEAGNLMNEKALEAMFHSELKDWEEAINHYLLTGKRLDHS